MKYFLIVYRQSTGVAELREFDEADRLEALEQRFEAESRARGDSDVEVVVLSAPDLDALKKTHARYFKSVEELATAG
jgi:hypothetical protein